MAKKIVYDDEATSKLFNGVEAIAKAVKVTLGPCGENVMLGKEFGSPTVTKDGVTVAKSIELEDPVENQGAQLVREVASKTNDVAGDNTTTATVLAYAIVKEGLKSVAAGMKPIEVKRGIDAATNDVIEQLKNISKPISSAKEITDVATISANNDPEIGNILADAINKVGKDGVITVEESKNMTTTVRVVDGMQWDKGWINPYFSTNKERLEAEYDDAAILITDKKISSMAQLMPILEPIAQKGRPLAIICDDMDGEALGTLVLNAVRGALKVVAIKAPGFGDNRKAMLEDMAILTGATYISDDFGNSLEKATEDMLGTAKIKCTKDDTTLTNGGGDKDKLAARIEELKGQIKNCKEKYDQDKLKARLAKLTGGVAVVSVGAATETELKEKKFRVEDTIAATRAALEEGIIPGGGVALVNARNAVDSKTLGSADMDAGYNILLKSVEEPLKQIAENAGTNGEVVLAALKDKQTGFGYNARTNEYCNMIEAGIIDTTKAMRNALLNAASIAGMILTTKCVVVDLPKKEEPMMQTPMGPMPY